MTLQEALEYIFNLFYTEIRTPMQRALVNSGLVNNSNDFLNKLLNSFFNIFRETPIENISYINNNSLADIITVIIMIMFILVFINLIKEAYKLLFDSFKNMFIIEDKKEWRSTWKRRKKKR